MEESEELRFFSNQSRVCRLTQELESFYSNIKSLKEKWRRDALVRDELTAINHTLTDWIAQLKLENNSLKKSLDTLKWKQLVPSGVNT